MVFRAITPRQSIDVAPARPHSRIALIELVVPARTRQSGGLRRVHTLGMRRELNASHKIIAASVPSAPNTSPISEPAVGTSRKSRSARIGSTTRIAPTDIAAMIQILLRYM